MKKQQKNPLEPARKPMFTRYLAEELKEVTGGATADNDGGWLGGSPDPDPNSCTFRGDYDY